MHRLKLILFLTPVILIIVTVVPILAQDKHTVRSGETLYAIARSYNISIDNLHQWNDLNGNTLSIGQVLYVSNPASKQNSENGPIKSKGAVHEVMAGETLYLISRRYDVSVNDIKSWNDLNTDLLDVGQHLNIYQSSDSNVTQINTTQTTENAPLTRPSQTYHQVERGETLYKISQQYNMSITALQKSNNLESTTLNVGQRLIVDSQRGANTRQNPDQADVRNDLAPSIREGAFVKHEMGENETLEGLLTRYDMDEEEFAMLNPKHELKGGKEVVVLTPSRQSGKNPYRVSTELESSGNIAVTVYDPQQIGSSTTSGDLYNPNHLTGAHPSIRLGKVVYIENPDTGRGIFVQVNDRVTGNFLKLSAASFNALGFNGKEEFSAKIYDELPD